MLLYMYGGNGSRATDLKWWLLTLHSQRQRRTMIFADFVFRRTRILADVLSFQIIQMHGFCVLARHSHAL